MEQSNHKHNPQQSSEFTTLPIDRLEQLGYQYRTERCDGHTTLTIKPVDEEIKVEKLVHELALNHKTQEQQN